MTSPRALFSILFNAEKAVDVLETARALGILARLDAGPVTLARLAEETGARPARLYKFLDCLESLDLVERVQPDEDRLAATYRSREPLAEAAEAVFGPRSLERDRDRYDWRVIHRRLPEVLRGQRSIESFGWPPSTPSQIAEFEASMAVGCPPIIESFLRARGAFLPAAASSPSRWLDVGGGDGALAAGVLTEVASLEADVFNLPSTRPLVEARIEAAGLRGRMRFVGGDFFSEPLPGGYDVVSFVRVLHDWDERRARELLAAGARALAPGGRLVICEEFRTRERLAAQFFWTYFLMGVDACESRLREVELYVHELRALGLDEVRVLPGAFDVVVATRAL